LGVYGLVADLEDAPYATPDGDRPPVVAISFPVRRDEGNCTWFAVAMLPLLLAMKRPAKAGLAIA
jgi:hypothetical protein